MSDTNRIKHVTLRFFFVCLSFDTFSLVLTKARKRKGLGRMKENNKKEWYLGMGFVGSVLLSIGLFCIYKAVVMRYNKDEDYDTN